MLLLFNKTIKPLNQFVKKIQKSVLGAAVEDPFYHFIFSHFFCCCCCYTQILMDPSFMQNFKKGTNRCGLIQEVIDKEQQFSNIRRRYNDNFNTAY